MIFVHIKSTLKEMKVYKINANFKVGLSPSKKTLLFASLEAL